jgi:peptide/nickel transport system permease protein
MTARWSGAIFVASRLGQSLLILWAAFTLSFIILYAVPGDPAMLMLGGGDAISVTPEDLEAFRAEYGFDQPLVVQYADRLVGVLHGDLGVSYQSHEPVSSRLVSAMGPSLQLVGFSLVIVLIVGIGVGSAAAFTRSQPLARFLESLPSLGASLPTFWTGLVLMQVLSFQLRWLPVAGDVGFATLVMPGIALAIPATAALAQVIAKSLRTAMGEPYIQVARARGASERRVFLAHAFPNALMPTATVLGLVVATMFVGATIVETIFARRGIGFLLHGAVMSKDIPVVQGVTLVIASVYVILNLVVDLVYPLLDPRVAATRTTARKRVKLLDSPA